jgi:hypothetical protein
MGVIAQEVQRLFPELIEVQPNGKLMVDYDGLVPPLMTAVGELETRMAEIEVQRGIARRLGDTAGSEVRTSLDPDEIGKIYPELVITNEEGEREVAYEGFVGLLIEAVRELDQRLTGIEESEGESSGGE